MSTIHPQHDDALIAQWLGAYDASPPSEAFRDQLHESLRRELHAAAGRTRRKVGSPNAKRRGTALLWPGLAAAALLLAVGGVALRWMTHPGEVAQRAAQPGVNEQPLAGEQPNSLRTVAIAADSARLPDERAPVEPPHAPARANASDPELAREYARSTPEFDDGPMHLVLHTDIAKSTPEERQWRQAWCWMMQTEPSGGEGHPRGGGDDEAADPSVFDDYDLAYRVQTAIGARKQFDPLVQPLLVEMSDARNFIAALSEMNEEDVEQLSAQLNGEMATAAKLYVELLLRSRREQDIQQIDHQLHRALASDQVDDTRRELLRRWIRQLDAEKQRRYGGPMMM